jgi:hypothetical protein
MAAYRGRKEIASGVPAFDGLEIRKVHYWDAVKYAAELTNIISDSDIDQGVRNDCYYVVSEGAGILRYEWTAAQAIASNAAGILAAKTIGTEAAAVTTGILAMPGCARNVTITGTGTAADVKAAAIKVTGLNIHGVEISEDITPTVNDNTITAGVKAFASVTKIEFPAQDGAAAAFSVGFGEKLGLPWMLTKAYVTAASLGGTKEGTLPTVVIDSDEVEKNTVDLNSALNGGAVQVFFTK